MLKILIVVNQCNLDGKLKKIDILDVIYWTAEAWDDVEPVTIVRSWRKLLDHKATDKAWGNFKNQKEGENLSGTVTNENLEEIVDPEEDRRLIELLREIPGCSDMVKEDVEAWMNANGRPVS